MSLTLLPTALAAFLIACAPNVDPATEAPLIFVETHGSVWALHDDVAATVPAAVASVPHVCDSRTGCEYEPRSYAEAIAAAGVLIARSEVSPPCRRGVSVCAAGVDVGVAQVNSNNFPRLGVDAADMLHPCSNLRQSSTLLNEAYQSEFAAVRAPTVFLREQWALRRAYGVYNSGKPYGSPVYVANILAAAREPWVAATIAAARMLQRQLGFAPKASNRTDGRAVKSFSAAGAEKVGRVAAKLSRRIGCLRVFSEIEPARLLAAAAIGFSPRSQGSRDAG